MATMSVAGNLAGRIEEFLDRFAGSIVLGYGRILTAGGEDFVYSSLQGAGLTIPTSGTAALTGQVTGLTLVRWNLTDPDADRFTDLWTASGFSVPGGALFDLVARTATGVRVEVDMAPLLQAMNARAWVITGSAGRDVMSHGPDLSLRLGDRLSGRQGDDDLGGGAGRDTLDGGQGADRLWGGTQDDRLLGGSGADRLTGGAGADVFVFARGSGHDRILDFQDGMDRIDLSGAARSVRADGRDTLVTVGADSIRLVGIDRADISAADFL